MYSQIAQFEATVVNGTTYFIAQPAVPSWPAVQLENECLGYEVSISDEMMSSTSYSDSSDSSALSPSWIAVPDVFYDYTSYHGLSEPAGLSDSGYGSDYESSSHDRTTSPGSFIDSILEGSAARIRLDNFQNIPRLEVRKLLESWRLTEDELKMAGYPRMDRDGRVEVQPTFWERNRQTWIEENEKLRQCSRCHQIFQIRSNGAFPAQKGMCQYTAKRVKRTANFHVTSQRFASELLKFEASPAPEGPWDSRSQQTYAMDCEMVLTLAGPALARVSLLDFEGQVVLDLLVRPDARIIDLCTEYSGITMGMMDRAKHNLESARQQVFNFVNADTILIGHSLESDLKAMRIVHSNVIDTSIIYQDEGRNKVALRELARQYLGRTIQAGEGTVLGHCSEEDAMACLDLVKYRINYG